MEPTTSLPRGPRSGLVLRFRVDQSLVQHQVTTLQRSGVSPLPSTWSPQHRMLLSEANQQRLAHPKPQEELTAGDPLHGLLLYRLRSEIHFVKMHKTHLELILFPGSAERPPARSWSSAWKERDDFKAGSSEKTSYLI